MLCRQLLEKAQWRIADPTLPMHPETSFALSAVKKMTENSPPSIE
jgi:hypothetical protein